MLHQKHEIDNTVILLGKILKMMVFIIVIGHYLLHFEYAIFKGKQTSH